MLNVEDVVDPKIPYSIRRYNLSLGLTNYSQKNNEYFWRKKDLIVNNTNVCNATSICMAASYAGWRFPKEPFSQYKQEEDRLTAFCLEDPRVSEFYKSILPTFWQEWQEGEQDALPPNQVHRVLEYATNLWFGSTAVIFSEKVSMEDIANQIVNEKLPVVVSGKFPKTSEGKENINHIVAIVGIQIATYRNRLKVIEDTIDMDDYAIHSFIIDDPWGNFKEGYEKKLSGNDIELSWEFAKYHLKDVNNPNKKWAYLFKRGAAII
jgi:hypothetical protein